MTHDYVIQVFDGDSVIFEGYGGGSNAMEAIESAVMHKQVIIPSGRAVRLVAINENGFAIGFDASQL